MANDEKVANALKITDMIVTMLVKIFGIVQERRASLNKIEAQDGEISEADWRVSDAKFEAAMAAFDAAVADMEVEEDE